MYRIDGRFQGFFRGVPTPRPMRSNPAETRSKSVPFSALRNMLVGRARFELAVSWSQPGAKAYRIRLDISATSQFSRNSLNSLCLQPVQRLSITTSRRRINQPAT
jgi:hypothetical protein